MERQERPVSSVGFQSWARVVSGPCGGRIAVSVAGVDVRQLLERHGAVERNRSHEIALGGLGDHECGLEHLERAFDRHRGQQVRNRHERRAEAPAGKQETERDDPISRHQTDGVAGVDAERREAVRESSASRESSP